MKKKIILVLMLILLFGGESVLGAPAREADSTLEVAEGNDFATIELGNPWDMDSFTDISRGFNGDYFHITNFSVSNGVFSGQSTNGAASFYVLHPGYLPGMRSGTIGYLHPIDPNKYSCAYVASYVPSDSSPRYHWFSWIKDMHLTSGGGYTYGMRLDTGKWRLYGYDLSTWPYTAGEEEWTARNWQGFRVHVTDQTWANFQVDWVRLTDCTPVLVTMNGFTSNETYDIWIGHGNPERQILVAPDDKADYSGRLFLDVQGIEPDTYTYYVKQGSHIVRQGTLIVHAKPLPEFVSPSPLSGEEYSAWAGNPWDMSAPGDIAAAYCTEWDIASGVLNVNTKPGSQQPAKCRGSGANEADPIIYLNTPRTTDISQYRYLSFRHYIGGAWQLPAQGMVVRWIWRTVNPNDPEKYCEYVSPEVVLDVGWRTYWADLYDAFNGTPVETGGLNCPQNIPWKNQHNALLYFRIDPNENITNETFHQEFDWIGLHKMDEVIQGDSYYVRISLNKDPDTLEDMKLYYTDNVSNPKQHLAHGQFLGGFLHSSSTLSSPAEAPQALYQLYIPLVLANYKDIPNGITFRWDTEGVTPGVYTICAESNDGYNQSLYCSKAPVVVQSP